MYSKGDTGERGIGGTPHRHRGRVSGSGPQHLCASLRGHQADVLRDHRPEGKQRPRDPGGIRLQGARFPNRRSGRREKHRCSITVLGTPSWRFLLESGYKALSQACGNHPKDSGRPPSAHVPHGCGRQHLVQQPPTVKRENPRSVEAIGFTAAW